MASNETKWNSLILDQETHDIRLSVTFKDFLDYVCEPGQVMKTRNMDCSTNCGAKWRLEIYPYGASDDEKDDVAAYLCLDATRMRVELEKSTFELYVVGKDGRKVKTTGTFRNVDEANLKNGFGCPDLITRGELEDNEDLYLPDGHLTIRCEGTEFLKKLRQTLTIATLPELQPELQPVVKTEESSPCASGFMKKMYEEAICSDVVLKAAGSNEFKCHKAILAAHSAYFKAMFGKDNQKEKTENVVDLGKDCNQKTLKVLLDYIYLGKPELKNFSLFNLKTLLRMADKYEMAGLVEVSETGLIRQLNKDNAKELRAFAMSVCAKRLEKAAATIIGKKSE